MYSRWSARTRSETPKNGVITKDPYEYQALRTSTTIRLVKIYPERVRGCIACRIYHFDEEEQRNIQYRALSYVWGDPLATRQIFLKGPNDRWRPFPLHENLWQFLNRAWEQRLFDQFFWTDRLCLNQDNPEEISQQVPRMRTIYHNAELVLIWLHLEDNVERCVLEVVRRYNSQDGTSALRHSDVNTLFRWLENPYWTRIWIVQEVVVSRKVCVACGENLIPMEKLASLIKDAYEDLDMSFGETNEGPSIFELCKLRAHGQRPLNWLLAAFYHYHSSRPVDRLYGILGLVQNNDDGSSPTDNIQVDYSKPTSHAFLDAMFESSPGLDEIPRIRGYLGDLTTYDSHSLLEGYITHSKTMQRHKNLAQLALQALEACNILTSGPGAPSEELLASWFFDISASEKASENITLEQSAAVLGVALARSSSGPLDHWKARWRSRGEASSPWRCATHRSVDMPSYERFIQADLSRPLVDACVLKACGERSENCEGYPSLYCEIPQVGLRLTYHRSRHEGDVVLDIERMDRDSSDSDCARETAGG